MSKRRRSARHADGEDEGNERWLITYADMITLLMAFFIMMYAMSIVDLNKFHELAISVRGGFGGDVADMGLAGGTSGTGIVKPIAPPIAGGNSLVDISERIRANLRSAGLFDKVAVTNQGDALVISLMADGLFFDRGCADLRQDVRTILDTVAEVLKDMPNDIRIEGHTCDLPISTAEFPSNWELSAARAINCVVYLAKVWHISPERLAAIGYADTRPLAPNTSEANRAKNRRVDIIVVAEESPAARSAEAESVSEAAPPQADLPARQTAPTGAVRDEDSRTATAIQR